jgi:hypothetical protein
MKIDIPQFYREREILYSKIAAQTKKQLIWLSGVRLLLFLLIIACPFTLLKVLSGLIWLPIVLLLVLFLWLLKYYNLKQNIVAFNKELAKINKEEADSTSGKFDKTNTGNEFINPSHAYSYDLDIFGDGSLFQFINRTCTVSGKRKLSQYLTNPLLSIPMIHARQDAVKALSEMTDFRHQFRALGNLTQEKPNDVEIINNWLSEPHCFYGKPLYKYLIYLVPVLSVTLIILAAAGVIPWNSMGIYILLVLSGIALKLKTINKLYAKVGNKYLTIAKYAKLLDLLEKNLMQHPALIPFLSNIKKDKANKKLRKLSDINRSFDTRNNLPVSFILNVFFLWDIRCVYRLERWKDNNRNSFNKWSEELSEIDALSSIAGMTFNNPDFSFPQPNEDGVLLEAENISHPLLLSTSRVYNDVSVKDFGTFIVVTGANMSGKSTLLRSIGINLVLAMSGAPICSSLFRFRPLTLYTSMRTTDSLSKNESYFYAELKRLKFLIDALKQGNHIFILLDEILKGTNSTDKQLGSKMILNKLIQLNATGLIATHDLSLGEMQQEMPSHIFNKCFEIEVENSKIYFDYKLRDGISLRMNAALLIKQMELI